MIKKSSFRKIFNKYLSSLLKFEILRIFLIIVALLPFYFLLYKIYIPKTNAFGCFDDCMNYGAGYFMQYGKKLYSEIFFNHQPFMAYLSYSVQKITNPEGIYDLLLKHRQLLMLFSFLFNILIIRRFLLAGIVFVFTFELTKFYIFGDRFLAEAFIVYPMVYVTGLIYYKLQNRKIYNFEYILTAIFTWFIVFIREPFIPAALFEYLLLIGRPSILFKKISLVIFLILSITSVLLLPVKEYLFSVITINQGITNNGMREMQMFGIGMLKIFFYPIFIFLQGQWSEIRIILIANSLIFIPLSLNYVKHRKFKLILLIYVLLAIVNIRVIEPGQVFYAAFHMIPWFGMFILLTFLMLNDFQKKFKLKIMAYLLFAGFFLSYITYPQNFIRNKSKPHEEFLTNYGKAMAIGTTVSILSDPSNTFFIDSEDDINIAYFSSKRISPYQYSWYAYMAPYNKKYTNAEKEMFLKNPPDFFYGNLSDKILNQYQAVNSDGKPTVLYIKKSLIKNISEDKWEKVKEYRFDKPKNI